MIQLTSIKALAAAGINRAALTFGVFDGLHRGHRKIVDTLLTVARRHHAAPVLVTFEPHPQVVLQPDNPKKRLLSPAHKLHLLSSWGIHAVVVLPFTPELAALSASDFITETVFAGDTEVTAICVGDTWRYGAGARGDLALLRELSAEHPTEIIGVAEEFVDGEPASSSRVRRALEAGELELCEQLLDRNFSVLGSVERGKGIASDLKYPTANVASDNEVYPPLGIYAANARVNGDVTPRPGALYLGNSPTFLEAPPARPFLEMHLFDFNGDLYGQQIEVEFIRLIRGDQKFDSTAALRNQIADDIEKVREVHRNL